MNYFNLIIYIYILITVHKSIIRSGHELEAMRELVDASSDVGEENGDITNKLPCFKAFARRTRDMMIHDDKTSATINNGKNTAIFINTSSSKENAIIENVGSNHVNDGIKTRRYWTRRLWTFLSKVRELKSVPKQEKKLDDKSLYLLWMQQ